MKKMPGRRPRRTRLARALGLERNPLRRASDRARAWIRIGLLAIFLIAGPMAALSTGGWAYHAGITASEHAASAHPVSGTALRPAPGSGYLYRTTQPGAGTKWQRTLPSARSDEMVAVVMTLALIALALLAAQRLTVALLTRRCLAAWEVAWSRVGPQWSRGRP